MTDSIRPDGLVLAGGRGERVGGRDKGLLALNGKPLAQHVADYLGQYCEQVVICCNRNHQRYKTMGLPLCSDLRSDFEGPLAGIEAGFAATDNPHLMVAPCDTPGLPADLAPQLIEVMSSTDYEIVYAVAADQPHYLCALISRKVSAQLTEYLDSGSRSVRGWFGRQRTGTARFDDAIKNLNDLSSLGDMEGNR